MVFTFANYLPIRLALSHNHIYAFPSRLSECTSLRYLNVRSNVIREFPLPVSLGTSERRKEFKADMDFRYVT
jgi:hypothetical protein